MNEVERREDPQHWPEELHLMLRKQLLVFTQFCLLGIKTGRLGQNWEAESETVVSETKFPEFVQTSCTRH